MKKGMCFLAVMLSAVVLAGCGSSEADMPAVQTSEELQTEVTAEEATEAMTEEVLEEETEPEEMEMVVGGPDMETLEQIIGNVVDWVGLLYMYDDAVEVQTLTVQEALPMVGHAIVRWERIEESGEIPYDTMEGVYTVSPEMADSWTEKYFGTTYDISELVSDGTYGNQMVSAGENGDLMINVGDWGMMVPTYEFAGITELVEGQYIVSVYYSTYDYEEDKQSEPMYHMEYTLEKNEASEFGYVIVDVIGTSLQ